MAAPAFGAVDVGTLGADWEVQNTDGAKAPTIVRANGGNGDIIAETSHYPIQSGTITAIYVGAETGFIAALGSFWPGKLIASDTLIVLGNAIDYGPCAQGKRPLVTFTVRDGPTSAPATPFWYVTDLVLPTYVAANVIVPQALLTATLGSAEVTNAQWSLAMQLGADLTAAGAFLASQGYEGIETLTLTCKGIPTSITSSGWLTQTEPAAAIANSSNSDYPDHVYTFTRKVTRSVA
jgi:hypothetical protein